MFEVVAAHLGRLERYMTRLEQSGVLAVTPSTRALADQVLAPHAAMWAAPLGALNQIITIGLLPAWIRTVYGYAWDDTRDARFSRAMHVIRAVRRAAPARMARWRDAREQA